jgi:DNA repair exonuclease SbcCD ATPase subunit
MNEQQINYTKEAFLNPYNLGFLIMAMLVAFFLSGTEPWFNIVLILAAALELMYLGIVPRDERFQRVVRSRRAREHARPPSQKEIFQLLTRISQRRYARLRKLEKDIRTNYRKLAYSVQGLLESHLKKINGLLDSYLNLLYQKERYDYSLQSNTENEIARAISTLRADLEDDSPRVRAIKERRLRVLEQRLARFKKGRENLEIIEAQLETVEDVVKYIHEQSLTLRNPEEITFQLDTLLKEVEETEASVQELDDVFTRTPDLLADIDSFDLGGIDESAQERSRLRN